jgi:hypothetical protein
MTVELRPLAEITDEALSILFREMGIANTIRFLNQYTTGYGNYTEERDALFADMTLDDLVAAIKQHRNQLSQDFNE